MRPITLHKRGEQNHHQSPNSLPFPAMEANREILQQYLLDYYSSSTFNTCELQELPLLYSPPMRLMIDKNATPIAHHSPIPVHWQDAIKSYLDRDVRLGILEPVPIGEPVIWCHRMVICAKQNSTPRRTINFQLPVEQVFITYCLLLLQCCYYYYQCCYYYHLEHTQEKYSYTTDIVIVLIGYHDETGGGVNCGLCGTKNGLSISPLWVQ